MITKKMLDEKDKAIKQYAKMIRKLASYKFTQDNYEHGLRRSFQHDLVDSMTKVMISNLQFLDDPNSEDFKEAYQATVQETVRLISGIHHLHRHGMYPEKHTWKREVK